MKLRWIALTALCLACLLLVTACNTGTGGETTEGNAPAVTTEEPAASESETETETETETEVETADPAEAARAEAKSSFLALMNDAFSGDPDDLLSKFFGDFTLENAVLNPVEAGFPKRAYKKDNVYVVEQTDGSTKYAVISGTDVATVELVDGVYTVTGYQQDAENTDLSVFSLFQIDLSEPKDDEADDDSFADLITEDSIVVNEDGTECTLTEEVLDALVEELCDAFEGFEGNIDAFRESIDCDLEYTVKDNTLRITLAGTAEGFGALVLTVEVSSNETTGPQMRMTLDMDAVIQGVPAKVYAENSFTDIRYDDAGKLVGVVEKNYMEMDFSVTQMGITMAVHSTETQTVTMNAEDADAPSITVVSETETEMSFLGQTNKESTKSELSAVLGKNGRIAMKISAGDKVLGSIEADFRMEAPEVDLSEVKKAAEEFFAAQEKETESEQNPTVNPLV